MRFCIFATFFLVFIGLNTTCQPLTNGMGIITHWTGVSGQWNAFSIYDTENNATAPLGLNWPTTFYTPADPIAADSWKGTNMGDVFGIAIDDQKNVYFTATKSISSSGSTGTNAGVAGDGGVYKMDANTWVVTPFITTGNGANQIPNQGNGLGNIAHDKWNNQLFITNFEDGKIYRFDMNGNLLSTFDPFNPDATPLGTFSGHGEALWGIAVHNENGVVKVFFSQWTEDNSLTDASNPNNAVWSVNLDNTGEFTGNETLCFNLPDNTGSFTSGVVGASYPISDIAMSSDGNIYLCEKVQGGWSTFAGWDNLFTPGAHSSRLFEYVNNGGTWTPKQYYIGNYNAPNDADNTAGGVAIGNRQTDNGFDCEKILWASGDALRFFSYNSIPGPDYLYGLTGIPIEGNSMDPIATNYVQSSSIYIDVDYTGMGSDGSQKMSFGDVEIYSDAVNEPNFTITPSTTICEGESIQLSVSGGINYEWTPSSSLDNSAIDNPIASPSENTTYTVMGEGTCGSRDTVSVTISIDEFNFSLGPDAGYCEGMNEVIIDAGSQATSYQWNTNESNQFISVANEGLYSCTVTSPNGCPYYDEINIISYPVPTIEFYTPNDSACPPAIFHLIDSTIAQIDDPIIEWNWMIAGLQSNTSSTSVSLENSGSYDVSLEIVTEIGCRTSLSLMDYLTVHELPYADFSVEPKEISHCNKSLTIQNLSTNYDSVVWNFGDTSINYYIDSVSQYTYDEVGNYIISLISINEFGCKSSFNTEIVPTKRIPFYAPNAFTPDKDEINEVFKPILDCARNYELWITNRWGAVIFYSNDIDVGWDGTFEGQLAPVGVYTWKAKFDGAKHNQVKVGNVHLMH